MTQNAAMPAAHLQTFRVHFHDDVSVDIPAVDARTAEARAKKQRPGNFVKKIKLLREVAADTEVQA